MEKLFHLKENHTSVKTEILAGLTTFMTMAYILALNPNLLTGFAVGTPLWNAVFLATCLSSAIGTFAMAFLANQPFAMAPGMGINSFFAVICGNIAALLDTDYTSAFQAGLCIILVEGIVFLLISWLDKKHTFVTAIPEGIRRGIGPALGLMLLNIGFGSNAGIYTETGAGPYYVMRDFFGALSPSTIRETLGQSGYAAMVLHVLTMFLGLFVIVILAKKGKKSAVLAGMFLAAVFYWAGQYFVLHINPFADLQGVSFLPDFSSMFETTFLKFDFGGLFRLGWLTAVSMIITYCILDMYDTVGTLVGTASRSGMLDKDGNLPHLTRALFADAIGTVTGAATGTSTVTTFVESASGVEAGGRTGLTALTTGVLFLASLFIAPVAAVIPAAATSSALIYVGILMLQGLKDWDFGNPDQMVPSSIMLIAMPISGSISHSIGLGMIAHTIIYVFTGRAKQVSLLTYILSALFLVKFFVII